MRNASWIIARKELRDIFRDRRTLMNVVVSPLIITPALFALLGVLIKGQVEKAKTTQYAVAVIGADAKNPLLAKMQALPNIKPETVGSRAEAEEGIRKHKFAAAALLPAQIPDMVTTDAAVEIAILSDRGDEKSQAAAQTLETDFEAMGKGIVAARINAHALPADFAAPFKITQKEIPGGNGSALLFLTRMLPYMLILAAFGGAIYAAFDQVAGEKERGTLETLLVSPVSRRDIVLGKFAAVVGVCLISCVLSIVGLAVPFVSHLKVFDWLSRGGLTLSPVALLVVLLVLLPISVLFAGLLLAVSTFSRNQREAQTYLLALFPIVFIPAMISMLVDADVARSVALVPVLNGAIIIKQALSGTYNAGFIALAFVASVAYAAVTLIFATRLFQKESVLIKA